VVKLVETGTPEIVASDVQMSGGGRVISATFDLRGHAVGVRDLMIINPGPVSRAVPNAFTIEHGGAADVRISKTGTTPVRGRILDYFIVVENRGTIDSGPRMLTEALEPWFTLKSTNPTASQVVHARDAFPLSAGGKTYQAFITWNVTLAPQELRVLSYSVLLDAEMPIGAIVNGCIMEQVEDCFQDFADCWDVVPDDCDDKSHNLFLYATCLGGRYTRCIARGARCTGRVNLFCDDKPAAGPRDPNEKLVSEKTFIRPDQSLTYPIHYENVGNAEARDIFITDVLDPNLDVSTLRLLTPGAVFDAVTRTVKWSLLNANLPPKGTGNVLISVRPKPNLPSGTEIRNKATIQFEYLEKITTDETENIIDSTPPVCKVNPLPAQTTSTRIPLSWAGTDAVGEIDTYSVFMSVNNGSFRQLVKDTKDTTTVVAGGIGNTYGFYCTATDTVGNAESQVPSAEATTTVVQSNGSGDLNNDDVVDCKDIAIVRAAFGKRTGQAGFDARADVVIDAVIDVRDLAFVSQRLPAGTRCP
jgi:uncharacterized repeat protein (TIGR01451 family)